MDLLATARVVQYNKTPAFWFFCCAYYSLRNLKATDTPTSYTSVLFATFLQRPVLFLLWILSPFLFSITLGHQFSPFKLAYSCVFLSFSLKTKHKPTQTSHPPSTAAPPHGMPNVSEGCLQSYRIV